MISKSALRWMIAFEILLVIVALFIEDPGSYSPWGNGWGIDKWGGQALLLGWPLFIFRVAAYVGVFQFKTWGRKCYLFYHLLDLVSIFVPGVVHMPLLGAVFYWASYIVAAIILYFLYFTPLNVYFKIKEAAVEPVGPEVLGVANKKKLAALTQELAVEKGTAASGQKTVESPETKIEKKLIDTFTDWLFPKSAAKRAAEEPQERKKERRTLLLEHYVFILFIVFVIMLTEFEINGLVIVALCFVLFNLAHQKGAPFAVLSPVLLAVYCLVPIASSLFGYMLSSFSKSFLLYLIPYIAGWLLLFLLEIDTFKFIRKYDRPTQEVSRSEAPKITEP